MYVPINFHRRNYMKSIFKTFGPYVLVFILILLSTIPLSSLRSLVFERSNYKNQVEREITSQWGGSFNFGKVQLSVPFQYKYKKRREVRVSKDEYKEVLETKYSRDIKHFAAKVLKAKSKVVVQRRYKGIYEVPIFRVKTESLITFDKVTKKDLAYNFSKIIQSETGIYLGLKVGNEVTGVEASVNDQKVQVLARNGEIFLPVKSFKLNEELQIKLAFDYNGTRSLNFEPSAETSTFSIESNWKDPKFIGGRLPSKREITEKGFKATWEVMSFGNPNRYFEARETFGVELIDVLNIYHLNERTLKYGLLFIILTIGCVFLVQVVKKTKVHPIQLIFVMCSMVEFYFILLSLSEHISFSIAYLVASLATIATIGFYIKGIFKDPKAALVIVLELVILYLFLYSTVASRDYALLIGSTGLFCLIVSAMYVTRKIDWELVSAGQVSS